MADSKVSVNFFQTSTWQSRANGLVLMVIFALGIGIRLYDLTDPPLDFYASRQLRSAIIARSIYYQLNANLDPALRQMAEGLAKLEVYEPPILENIVGFTDYLIGGEFFWIGRIYNAIFWALGGLALYLAGRRFASFPAILVGLSYYFFLPFSVIGSRSFQPDPWMVMWIFITAFTLYRWAETKTWKWAFIAGVAGGIAILVKVMAGFFVVGMLAILTITVVGFKRLFRDPQPWLIGVLMLSPALVYYLALNPQRSGDFLSFWTVGLSGLVTSTHFYADWLAMVKGLTGLTMFMAALLGVLLAEKKMRSLLIGGWLGYGLFGLTFPYQYITHDYYHLALIPLIALSVLPVLDAFFDVLRKQQWVWQATAVAILVFAAGYSLYVSRSILYAADYALEPASWARVGAALPEGRPFVALTADYGMRLSYYGWRNITAAWPSTADLKLSALSGNDPLEYENYFNEVTAGKDYFLVTAFSELDAQPQLKELLTDRYPVYVEGNGFIIYDLTDPLE